MMRRFYTVLLALILALPLWRQMRVWRRPRLSDDSRWAERAKGVLILRDTWGIPHVFAKTDADAAFGLAYAQAEDNSPLLIGSLAAARGKLSMITLSREAAMNDFLVRWLHIPEELDARYEKDLSPETRKVLEGYAEGINHWAALHPEKIDGRFLPMSGRDIAAGFLHKLPLFEGLAGRLKRAMAETSPPATTPTAGSNAHAVHASRSTDGVTRLNINSHQPWEGPVAWYEAQVVSEEGWNMTGGTFPGAPFILHGHNEFLGWAHTVNRPKLIESWKIDDKTKLQSETIPITIDTGFLDLTIHKTVYRTAAGEPVLETPSGLVGFRYAGMGKLLAAPEQWFRMNKARNIDEWKAAMGRQGLPMFNTVYADRSNIYYVYNALLRQADGAYLPFDRLPHVENPPSGFVQNCNSTPFATTEGAGNPNPADYDAAFGIETRLTNRAVRSLELFGGTAKISREDFLRFKFDRTYSKASSLYRDVVGALKEAAPAMTGSEREAADLLAAWDGRADDGSPGAALAVLTLRPIAHQRELEPDTLPPTPREALSAAAAFLSHQYGKLDIPLTRLQRLRRGKVDLPLGGGPDVLNAAYSRLDADGLVGEVGDSYILFVDFPKDGPAVSSAIHQFGASSVPSSPHYADQAPLFIRRELRPSWRRPEEIRAHLEREYHPGDELANSGPRG